MKCAFNPCGEVNHLPIKLTTATSESHFCGLTHLIGYLVQHMSESGLAQAVAVIKTPAGRKALAGYLVERFL
jgi:hypothetical protein